MPASNFRRGNSSQESAAGSVVPRIPKIAVNNQIRLTYYFRSAKFLLKQAELYRLEHDERQLFTMLMRFASLVVETMPQHKDFDGRRPPQEYAVLKRDLMGRFMGELEAVKLALQLKGQEAEAGQLMHQQGLAPDTQQLTTSPLSQLDWDALGTPPQPSAPHAPPPPQAPPSSQPSWQLPQSMDPWDLAAASSPAPSQAQAALALPTFDSSSYLPVSEAARERHLLLSTGLSHRPRTRSGPLAAPVYPHPVPRPDPVQQASLMDADHRPPGGLPDLMPSPQLELQLGPQQLEVQTQSASQASTANGCCTPPPPPPPAPPQAPDAQVSDTAGDVSKQRHEIREVHVSAGLMEEFLRYAKSNTSRSIESCGILAGVLDLAADTFSITTLIVPKQEGTSDTVAALGEEEIFEVQDSRSLFPLGWIHTHPSQTCFLSSIDIHTQCGYQTMLDEAVAIVMAPRDSKRRCGIFRLSTPGGLKLVQKCPSRGFHMHPTPDTGQPIYEVCGHVYLNPRLQHEVIDLR